MAYADFLLIDVGTVAGPCVVSSIVLVSRVICVDDEGCGVTLGRFDGASNELFDGFIPFLSTQEWAGDSGL